MPTPLVMISYSHENKSIARRLATDLQEDGLDVWLDEREVLIGDSIHTKVQEGLSNCDYLVVLLSTASLSSAWVRDEVHAAMAREKHSGKTLLLPAVLEGVDFSKLPPLLGDRRFAVLSRYDEGLQDLEKSIRGHEDRRRRDGA